MAAQSLAFGRDVSPLPALLLATKLSAPAYRDHIVPRPQLRTLLEASPPRTLTLVEAPAGSSKTTLLSEWAAGLDCCGWVSLDAGDNDPVRFWSYVAEALQRVAPGVGTAALLLLGAARTSVAREVLPVLINDLAEWNARMVVVLDDYHVVTNREIHEQMTLLLDHLPRAAHLVIASRTEPPLPLPRMRARGQVLEIRSIDLQFTRDEAVTLLNDLLGLGLSDQDVARLYGRTEGWAPVCTWRRSRCAGGRTLASSSRRSPVTTGTSSTTSAGRCSAVSPRLSGRSSCAPQSWSAFAVRCAMP